MGCLLTCCDCLKSDKQLNPYFTGEKNSKINDTGGTVVSSAPSLPYSFENKFSTQISTVCENRGYEGDSPNQSSIETDSSSKFPEGNYVYKLQPSALKALAKHLSNNNLAIGTQEQDSDTKQVTRNDSFKIVYDNNASF